MVLPVITLGSDPEVFIEIDGEVVSGIGLIPGDKENPHEITDEGHAIQVDGVAWEYNIPPSASCDEFVKNIVFVREYLREEAKKHGAVLSTFSSFELAKKYLAHPDAQRLGCEPDFNAYLQDYNPTPSAKTRLRVVGGHVHIGYPNPDIETTDKIVKMFDLLLTLPAVIKDPDVRRREQYGKPGSFRFKDFGLECRALSNFWIHTEENIRWVYNQTVKAAQFVITEPTKSNEALALFSERAVTIINNNDVAGAALLIEEIEVFLK